MDLSLWIGLTAGAAIAWWMARARCQLKLGKLRQELSQQVSALREERSRLLTRLERVGALETQLRERDELLAQERTAVTSLRTKQSELQTRLQEERKQSGEKLQLLEEARQSLVDQFKSLAGDILEDKSKRFTEQNKTNIDTMLKPLREQIKDFEKKVGDTYDKESKDRVALHSEIRALKELGLRMSEDALNLTTALKTESKTQGSWGEMILERILETSGLQKGREYDVQVALKDAGGKRQQPDVVINLPEGKHIVIDSKVSLTAYERFCSEPNEQLKRAELLDHIQSLRTHVIGLAQRDYHKLFGIKALDYVLMFVPVESAFIEAMRAEPKLFTEALDRNILIVSPTLLLTTLRTIQNLWRFENQSRNAQDIAKKAGALYDKFIGFVDDLEEVGKRLSAAQSAYDGAHKKLSTGRGNLVRKAEELKSLGANTSKSLPEPLVADACENGELPLLNPRLVS